ncbi:MAG: hypothetical protein JNK48_24395 [Bryobacterales bacterium]|nr:hypothetical protein [Bryobacterales bacterium]
MVVRGAIVAFLGFALTFAQAPADLFSKAPPAVDEALRDRANKFYQAHVDGKFRIADQFVAEDSKDAFYEAEKRRCRTFRIASIAYKEEFTQASVVIECDTEVLIPPKGLTSVRMPVGSTWRVENGVWVWYLVKTITRQSPFGEMKPGEGSATGSFQIPTGPTVEQLQNAVQASRRKIKFDVDKPGEGTVDITNSFPGGVKLEMTPMFAHDLQITLDKTDLKDGETARLHVKYTPSKRHARVADTFSQIRIVAAPIQTAIVVHLEFAR